MLDDKQVDTIVEDIVGPLREIADEETLEDLEMLAGIFVSAQPEMARMAEELSPQPHVERSEPIAKDEIDQAVGVKAKTKANGA